MCTKKLLQLRAAHAVGQIAYVQLLAHRNSPMRRAYRPALSLSGSLSKGVDVPTQTVGGRLRQDSADLHTDNVTYRTHSSNQPVNILSVSPGHVQWNFNPDIA